jgi:hypothetical protein
VNRGKQRLGRRRRHLCHPSPWQLLLVAGAWYYRSTRSSYRLREAKGAGRICTASQRIENPRVRHRGAI